MSRNKYTVPGIPSPEFPTGGSILHCHNQENHEKKRTHRLQVVRTTSGANDPHLYGTLTVTAREAQVGSRKLVNIPWGFQKRILNVTVPPGVRDGTRLRLEGMGKRIDEMRRGDLYLKIKVENRG